MHRTPAARSTRSGRSPLASMAAKKGLAGSAPGPLALMGQRDMGQGCSAVSTCGPQQMREEPRLRCRLETMKNRKK